MLVGFFGDDSCDILCAIGKDEWYFVEGECEGK